MTDVKGSVLVLYNFVGEDEYERLKDVDPTSLDFEPEYDIDVTTVMQEYRAVGRALRRQGYHVRSVNIKDNLTKLENLIRRNKSDVVFNLIEFFHDDTEFEPNVAALFELHQVAYTGSGPLALAMCRNKVLTKRQLLAYEVPTPRFVVVDEPRMPKRPKLRFPLIVKPPLEDASSGVEQGSVVHDAEALEQRLAYVHREFGAPILVEEFLDGPELHVGILGNDPPEMLPPIQWDFSEMPEDHPHIISFAAKWNPLAEVFHRVHSICPPKLPRRVLRKVEQVAIDAYDVLGCRDYARLDIRLDRQGHPFVLEANPNPDLTEGVSYMESAEAAGLTFGETLERIVEFALRRKRDLDDLRAQRRKKPARRPPASPEAVAATLDGYPEAPSNEPTAGPGPETTLHEPPS